jgi:diguanylate cyclase (GGDEF)-like protein
VCAAPLRDETGRVTGAVEVFRDDSPRRALAERLTATERAALIDPLTGVGNRRMLERALERADSEFTKYGLAYAALLVDVDNFKKVNDEHGHDAGDRVLRLVAETLQSCVRPSESVGRWGGDEFLLVAAASSRAQVRALAERLRLVTATAWLTMPAGNVAVTLSVGAAVSADGESWTDVLKRADAAVYAAKATGRNRTVISPCLRRSPARRRPGKAPASGTTG